VQQYTNSASLRCASTSALGIDNIVTVRQGASIVAGLELLTLDSCRFVADSVVRVYMYVRCSNVTMNDDERHNRIHTNERFMLL